MNLIDDIDILQKMREGGANEPVPAPDIAPDDDLAMDLAMNEDQIMMNDATNDPAEFMLPEAEAALEIEDNSVALETQTFSGKPSAEPHPEQLMESTESQVEDLLDPAQAELDDGLTLDPALAHATSSSTVTGQTQIVRPVIESNQSDIIQTPYPDAGKVAEQAFEERVSPRRTRRNKVYNDQGKHDPQTTPLLLANSIRDLINSNFKLDPHTFIGISRANRTILTEALPKWLSPFIKTLQGVKIDAHSGYRAITISLGKPEKDHLLIRKQLSAEIISHPNTYSDRVCEALMGCSRLECIQQIEGNDPSVTVNDKGGFISGMAAIVANTFDRPVLYYSSNIKSCTTTYPYRTKLNDHPPVQISYLDGHHIAITLQTQQDLIPFPPVCKTWSRHHELQADSWNQRFPKASFELYGLLSGSSKNSKQNKGK